MILPKNNQKSHHKAFVPKTLVPNLSEEVKQASVGGVYGIELPELVKFRMPYPGEPNGETVPAIQFKCKSLFTKSPDTLHKCNQTIKTLIGQGSGDQIEIVSCGKCRTSYLIRTTYDDAGHLTVATSVWEINRNIKNYCKVKRDKDYKVWLEFNSEEKKKEKEDE